MHPKILAKIELPEFLTNPFRLLGDVKIGKVDILVHKVSGVFRLLLSQIFLTHLTGAEIGHECLFYAPGGAFCPAVEQHEAHNSKGYYKDKEDRNMEQPCQHVEDEAYGYHVTKYNSCNQRCAVCTVPLPEFMESLGAVVLDDDCPEERRQNSKDNHRCYYPAPNPGNPFLCKWIQEAESQQADCHGDNSVEGNALGNSAKVLFPGAVLFRSGLRRFRISVHKVLGLLREGLINQIICRFRKPNHIWRKEYRDYRYRHNNRIQEVTGNTQSNAKGCDDERKLTNLGKGETALECSTEPLAGKQHAKGGERCLAYDDGERDNENGKPVLAYERRIHHHAHGHEENGAEQILDRFYQALYMLRLQRFRQDGAHDEGAECCGKAGLSGNHHHHETKAQGHYQKGLITEEFLYLAKD